MTTSGTGVIAARAMFGEAAKKAALVAGAQLKMLRPKQRVYGLIAETGLGRVFDCFNDEQTAVRSFGAGARAPRQ